MRITLIIEADTPAALVVAAKAAARFVDLNDDVAPLAPVGGPGAILTPGDLDLGGTGAGYRFTGTATP